MTIENTKTTIDVAAASITVGTVMSILPAIAALFTIIWTIIRIYETKTVQKILSRWRKKEE
jgi:hypothetical protein